MNWKKIFLDNAELAMEPTKLVKAYKEENSKLQSQIDNYAKMTVEKEWLEGCSEAEFRNEVRTKLQNKRSALRSKCFLENLDLFNKKELIESELNISVSAQCKLIKLNQTPIQLLSATKSIQIMPPFSLKLP